MGKADDMIRRMGNNLTESLGARSTVPSPAPPEGAASGPDPMDGFARNRSAGLMAIDKIVPDPNQPRETFDEESLDALARSLRERGQLLPVRVRWDAGLGKWVLVSGERRYRAAIKAGLDTLSCLFIDRELTPAEVLTEQLMENLLREDLRPIEEAKAYRKLIEINTWTGKQLAESLHISPAKVSKALSLLKLPDDVQRHVDTGQLPPSAAYELGKVSDARAQRELAAKVVQKALTHKETAAAARQRKPHASARRTTHETFRADNGLKITITANKRAGLKDIQTALRQALEHFRSRQAA
jgi:ParB family chromosome partitioning protein